MTVAAGGDPMISVVIPIFEEVAILRELRNRLHAALTPITPDYEIIFVLDGGQDGSWEMIGTLATEDARVKGVAFSRNFGQHLAISAGLDVCSGDWAVVMDGDLQDRPEVIPALYAKALEGYDAVFVARRNRPESPFYLAVARLFHKTFQLLSGTESDPDVANFSIVSRQVVRQYRRLREPLRFYGGIVHWLGFRQATITADHGTRLAGRSGYAGWFKRFRLAAHIILAHSERPLYFSVGIGFVMAVAALCAGIYFFLVALLHGTADVPGWASLITAIFFTSGLILIVLGIIGIYLGKIFNAVKFRPLYVVARRIGLPDDLTPPGIS